MLRVIGVMSIKCVTRKRYPAEGFLIKCEVRGFAVRPGIALLNFMQMSLNVPAKCDLVFYGKMKSLMVAFLLQLFASNESGKFFYQVTLVFQI